MFSWWIGGVVAGILAVVGAIFAARLQSGSTTKKGYIITGLVGLLTAVLSATMYFVQAQPNTALSCKTTGFCPQSTAPGTSPSVSTGTSTIATHSVSAGVSSNASNTPGTGYSADSILYLYELDSVNDNNAFSQSADIVINQKSYPKSVAISASEYIKESWAEFNIPTGYKRITGTLGHTSKSGSTCNVKATVQINGATVFSQEMKFGQEADLNVPLNNGLRVKLLVTYLSGRQSGANCNFGFGSLAFVNP